MTVTQIKFKGSTMCPCASTDIFLTTHVYCVLRVGWRRLAKSSNHPLSMICISIYRLHWKNKIKQNKSTSPEQIMPQNGPQNTLELHSSHFHSITSLWMLRWSLFYQNHTQVTIYDDEATSEQVYRHSQRGNVTVWVFFWSVDPYGWIS